MSRQLFLNLNDLTTQVATALNDNASLIYWHHSVGQFSWMRASDRNVYHSERRNLKKMIKTDTIINVNAGESFPIEGRTLYPLEIELRDVKCHAYMLIRRRGRLDDADVTPYLFVSQKSRDDAMTFLTNELQRRCV